MPLNLSLLEAERLESSLKGYPVPVPPLRITEVGGQGWNLRSSRLGFPLLTIRPVELLHNIRVMQAFCDDHDVLLAPQIASTLAPQIMQWQEEAGAWGFTASHPSHLKMAARFGMRRLICEAAPAGDAQESLFIGLHQRGVELTVIVDSEGEVRKLAAAVRRASLAAPIDCLTTAGSPQVDAVAAALSEVRPALAAAGVAVEGDETSLDEALSVLRRHDLVGPSFLVSVGRRSDLSRSIAALSHNWPSARLVVRPDCHVGSSGADGPADLDLRQAVELWSEVVSDSDGGSARLGFGYDDASIEGGPPLPQWRVSTEGRRVPVHRWRIGAIDKAATEFVLEESDAVVEGNRIISNVVDGSGTLLRWKLALAIDGDDNVIGAIRVLS